MVVSHPLRFTSLKFREGDPIGTWWGDPELSSLVISPKAAFKEMRLHNVCVVEL